MNEIDKDLIYLLSCAVNGIVPDSERVRSADMDKLYGYSKYHSVQSAVCIALERAGVIHKQFHEEMNKIIRNNILFDMERQAILDEFEKHGIWYMPLKGAILKELYPENGMRQMADNDILYDSTKQDTVKIIMLSKGYSAESIGNNHHDIYHKLPVLNFELHTCLFKETHVNKSLYKYYSDYMRLLKKDPENGFGYHLSDEDFYVFMTAHEYKHFSLSGTGIRSLLDCYVYCKEKGSQLDWKYINEQCIKLEIADYEQQRRELSMKVFSSDELSVLNEAENEMLMHYLKMGTYGTYENGIENKLKNQSKAGYVLHNVFPSVKYIRRSVGFVDKWPVLYPVGIVYRWGRIMVKRRSYLFTTINVLKKKENQKA